MTDKNTNEILLFKIDELHCSAGAVSSLEISERDKGLILLGQITDLFFSSQAIASANSDGTDGARHEQ